jgi:hypothetical protein
MFKHRRTSAIKDLALLNGFDYEEKDDWGLINLLKDFRLFRKGGSKRFRNMLIDRDRARTYDFRVFDYAYTVSTGKSSVTYTQTVFYVHSKNLGLPEFWMKPEHFFNKVASWFGYNDIDFDGYPVFSEQYFLKGPDEYFIRVNMNEDILNFFSFEKGWHLEGVNYFMIMYRHNKLMKPHEIMDFYHTGKRIYNYFKMPANPSEPDDGIV